MKSYHDIEQIIQRLSAQDDEIVKQTRMMLQLHQSAGISLEQIAEILQVKTVAVDGNEATSGATPASDAKMA